MLGIIFAVLSGVAVTALAIRVMADIIGTLLSEAAALTGGSFSGSGLLAGIVIGFLVILGIRMLRARNGKGKIRE